MLDAKGFDLWADGYDRCTQVSDEENQYPFAGYKKVLGTLYETILREKSTGTVLDIGFGTAVLTEKLYQRGYSICGIDFSQNMLAKAKAKMPRAQLVQYDFLKGLPPELDAMQYDFIISSYALHHLTDAAKIPFLKMLYAHLRSGGKLLIGDVAFTDRAALETCRDACAPGIWDTDEYYFVYEELKNAFASTVHFDPLSPCAGILSLTK